VTGSSCPLCGEPLTPNGPGCMRCLLLGGLEELDGEAIDQPPTHDSGAALVAPSDFGEYEIARREEDGAPWELGRGAMGVTYRAHDTVLHHAVALKVIDADLAAHPRAQARFLREARAAAGLRHPNIAGVFRFGVCPDGRCFYAMELVEGETLEERVRRDGPLPVALALEIVEQIAGALASAEKAGVVHRDLKPSNIMIAPDREGDGASPVVKIIDFGLAKAAAATSTTQEAKLTMGGFIGTPGFASPEQFDPNAALDVRSDIFSLGVTLWYLLTGNVPFVGHSLAEIRNRQINEQLPVARLAEAGIPAPVVDLLRELLAVDLAERPQSARALSERLRRCREELKTSAGAQPRRPYTYLVAAIVLVLLLGGAGAYFVARRASSPVSTSTATADEGKSIAVLPFENLSADQANAFFADGIQNEIITNLGRVAGLKVISRTSVMSYRAAAGGRTGLRETGRALGVAYLLEGSVQRAGNQVRINAQLIDARTEAQVWSKRYDRELADIFAIQDQLAEQIAADLHVELSPAERAAIKSPPTADVAAYDLHLRARQLLAAFEDSFQSHEMFPEAIRLLEAAVARDPNFVRAWCDLAKAHLDLYWYGFDRTPERLAKAGTAIDTAIRLNPNAGETHLALAEYRYHGFRDYERARTELALARLTLPNSAEIPFLTGTVDRRQNRWAESERNMRRALELDPRNPRILEQLAINFRLQRRYAEADQLLAKALDLTPGSIELKQARARIKLDAVGQPDELCDTLAAILRDQPEATGDVAKAKLECALCQREAAAAENALTLVPATGIPLHGATFPRAWFEGLLARSLGDESRAREAFAKARSEAERIVGAQPDFAFAHSVLGLIDAGLGHRDDAIREGQHAVELLPVTRDSIDGPELIINLAIIFAWVGEPDLAMDQLEEAAAIPSLVSYGLLKLHPQWDPLRGNPRFEALVAKMAPTGAK
jgi:TolB-like protein/cytochrome c-type biogenesis protein CcmH/NrfG